MIDQLDEPTTETTGTAVTTAKSRESALDRARRITNILAATITRTSWGRDMDDETRRAFAEYCHRHGVDPVSELVLLGGTPYVKSEWHKRKLGELRMAGIVRDVKLEHIHADPRLDALRKDEHAPDEIRAEANRRWYAAAFKRMEHNAPEAATAICVCTITLTSGETIVGCKWAGGGTSVKQPRSGGTSAPNPIAESNPTLFVESSALRRASVQLFSHLSGHSLRDGDDPDPPSAPPTRQRLSAAFAASMAIAEREAEPRPKMIASPPDPGDPYSV